ncbi:MULTISPECIES: hypothetical protein [unclassified Blastococcus]
MDGTSGRPAAPWLVLLLRVVGAGLLVAMAGIHLYLWQDGYDTIDWIGPLFMVNVIAGFALALAVLAAPGRWLAAVSALGALLQAGTLGALCLSVWVGLFGFQESTRAELFWETVWVEAAGAVVLAVLAVLAFPRSGVTRGTPSRTDRVRVR